MKRVNNCIYLNRFWKGVVLRPIYTSEVSREGEGDGDVRHLRTSVNQQTEKEAVKEEEWNVSFFFLLCLRLLH